MKRKINHKKIFFESLAITLIIFLIAIGLNYTMDFLRIGSVVDAINEQEISSESYYIEQDFIELFGGDKCKATSLKIEELKEEIHDVALELSSYGRISLLNRKDFDYLKRKYFLLELEFYNLLLELNKECDEPYVPILYFYDIDDDVSERQGFILEDISKKYLQNVVVLSIDKGYTDEPLIPLLIAKYNITVAPTIIINDEIKMDGLVYTKEIEEVIDSILSKNKKERAVFSLDFGYVLKESGIKQQFYIEELRKELKEGSHTWFAKGDMQLVLGRLLKDQEEICKSIDYFEAVETSNKEERALIYETIASLECGRDKSHYLLLASDIWSELGNNARAKIDLEIAYEQKPEIKFEIGEIKVGAESYRGTDKTFEIEIGNSRFILTPKDILVSQIDRVNRDWLGVQFNNIYSRDLLSTFSERFSYSEEELRDDIGWHEGARIKELKQAGLSHKTAPGTIIAEKDGKWYAPDENGVFRFEVPRDKVLYPTTRFLAQDIAVIIDTHGINMLVEQAVRNRASVVVGCCDHPGKIQAAQYLSDKGIKVICFPDKYLPMAMGREDLILGSPPIRKDKSKIVVGGQSISFFSNETIVASDVKDYTKAPSYYDTPARYFRNLDDIVDIDTVFVDFDGINQTGKLVNTARMYDSHIIGARVFNSDDYIKLKKWLEQDERNRAVLFHSMPYPYGYLLFKEFPEQTSFDDINPIIKEAQ